MPEVVVIFVVVVVFAVVGVVFIVIIVAIVVVTVVTNRSCCCRYRRCNHCVNTRIRDKRYRTPWQVAHWRGRITSAGSGS